MFRHCVLLLIFVCHGGVLAQESKSTAEAPKPSVSISFVRQALRENDSTKVEVWLNADTESKLTNVAARISSPEFLEWYDASCQQKSDQGRIQLDSVESGAAFHKELCLKSKADITAGEYNLLFTFNYEWSENDKIQTAFTSVEKPLKVNLLGSDSLAGIPLTLAGLIVPGVCFLLVLRAAKLTTKDGVDLMIHGVVVSLIFIAAAKVSRRFVEGSGGTWLAQKLQYLDASSNVSVDKLMWLAISGAAVGVLVALVHYGNSEFQNRRRQALEIKAGDDSATIVCKLLKRDPRYNRSAATLWLKDFFGKGNSSYRPLTTVRVKDDGEYLGTLGIRDGSSARLLGSYKVVVDGTTDPKLVTKLRRYSEKGWLLHAYNLAIKKKLPIRPQNEVTKASDKTSTGKAIETWEI